MTRLSIGSKKRVVLRPRKKDDDIFQDKWAPTPEEMRRAERAVCNSQTQSSVLQGKPRTPQHQQINNENRPNASRKSTGKVIYATPLPNPRIKKKAILYAKPIHPLPQPMAKSSAQSFTNPEPTTKKYAKPVHPLPTSSLLIQSTGNEGTTKKYAEPIHPLPEPSTEDNTATTEKAKKTRTLWSALDYYVSLPKQGEESKQEEAQPGTRRKNPFAEVEQESRSSKASRRKNPFAEDETEDALSDEDAHSIASSTISIQAKAERKQSRTSLFSLIRADKGDIASPVPKRENPFAADSSTQSTKSLVESNKEQATCGPVSLDEFVPITTIKVNSDQPITDANPPGFAGKLKKSLLPRRSQRKAGNQVAEPPPPTNEQERRQKPNAKPVAEFGTDDRLQQRKHRVQMGGNSMTNTIMTMDDTKTPASTTVSPMRSSPGNRDKASHGVEEANEAVEVMDLTTMSLESFQLSFQENSNACLTDVYEIDYPVHKSIVSGTLSIALPQDVFLLVSTQLSLLDEYLARNKLKRTPQGDRLLVDSILSILKNISDKQTQFRDTFLQDSFEGCIAAANSFMWMVEKVEEFMELVENKYPHLSWCDTDPVTWMPCQEAKELCSQFSQDAVLAASTEAVCFIMDDAHDAGLFSLLFSRQWEEELVHNEVSVSMTRILERKISVTSKWLEQDYLFHKFVGALVRATICFYMESIVHKAERLRSAGRTLGKKTARKKVAFRNVRKACGRLSDDIAVLQDYFEDIAEKNIALSRVISKEFSFLSLLVECMLHAGRMSHADDVEITEFVYAMHKETGANFDVTKHFLSDVWLLMGPKGAHHRVEAFINHMHEELGVFTPEDLKNAAMANSDMHGFKLHEVMLSLYEERIKNERTYIAIAEGAIKQTKRDIKKELKNTELRVQYFLEDLHDEFAAGLGAQPKLGEF